MILPNNNISIMDVRNCLGYPSMDLGTLCICDNVNMWSKHKPVIWHSNTTDDNPNWYKATDGKCGIEIPSLGSNFNIIDTSTWTRQKPGGGSGAPFRLGDFRGYNHNAKPLVSTNLIDDITVNRGSNSTWDFYPNIITNADSSNLSLDDISLGGKKLGDCYVAVRIDYNGYTVYACSASTIRNYPKISVNLSSFSSNMIGQKMTARFFICGDYFAQKTSWIIQDIQYCMYSDSTNKTSIGFTVKEVSMFTIRIDSIGKTLNSYSSVSNYASSNNALQLNIAGDVYLLCTMTNKTSGTYQVPLTNLLGNSSNWWGAAFQKSPVAFYNTSGSIISSSISIPPNGTAQIVIRWNYNNTSNTNPDGVTMRGNVNFKYLFNGVYVSVSNEQAAFYVKSDSI